LKVSANVKIAMQRFENFGGGNAPPLVARLHHSILTVSLHKKQRYKLLTWKGNVWLKMYHHWLCSAEEDSAFRCGHTKKYWVIKSLSFFRLSQVTSAPLHCYSNKW